MKLGGYWCRSCGIKWGARKRPILHSFQAIEASCDGCGKIKHTYKAYKFCIPVKAARRAIRERKAQEALEEY